MSTNNAAHTPGRWSAKYGISQMCDEGTTVAQVGRTYPDGGKWWIFSDAEEHGDFSSDASLIAEAGTVATETGLTPRQLAEQRAELLEALRSLLREHDAVFSGRPEGAKDSYYNAHPGRAVAYRNARAAIAKAIGSAP